MKKLGHLRYAMIEAGAKTFGTYDPAQIMDYSCQGLTKSEWNTVWAFLQWCHDNGKVFGHGNYEERFAEWKKVST